ncbi:MAG: hypothetical protein JXA93_16205 [Anaerolineae bacterium]|nr:hypothetical protein [Anaerolineae bacterium]
MDFGKILTRAWQITWRWKVLWILGFLASLGSGTGGSNFNYSFDESDMARWQMRGLDIPEEAVILVIALACIGILVAIAIWVISIIARGGLIAGVQQVENEGETTFIEAWRVGVRRFWTLFGITVLTALPILILVILFVAAMLVFGLGIAGTSEMGDGPLAFGIISTVACAGAFCCGLVILAILLSQIQLYADRAAVIEGMGWLDAFARGWQIIKENLGSTIVLWIIFLIIGLIVGVVILGAIAVVAAPFLAIFTNVDPEGWMFIPICFGGLLAMILGAIIGAIVNTFTSATWTLAYREFIGTPPPPETDIVEAIVEA